MKMLELLLQFISFALFYGFGIVVSSEDFSCIFSDNADKFSCHVVLNKQGFLFRSNIHLGRFMQWAVSSLRQAPRSVFYPLFMRGESKECFIADMAV